MRKSVALLIILLPFLPAISLPIDSENLFVIFENGKHGYIHSDGTLAIPPTLQQTYAINFSEGLAPFAEGHPEKWGFIDATGNPIIAAQFDNAGGFSEGTALVAFDTAKTRRPCADCDLEQQWGYITGKGQFRIKPQFRHASDFSEGLAAVQTADNKWRYIDQSGMSVIPGPFDTAGNFKDGLAVVALGGRCGYIDRQGKLVIRPNYAICNSFSEGLASVRIGGKSAFMVLGPAGGHWSFINKRGKTTIELPHGVQQAWDFSEGLAAIQIADSHCGYVNRSGLTVIAPVFSYCDAFSEGLADVLENGRWQYIDRNGNVILTTDYFEVYPFKNGLARVEVGDVGPNQKFGYIDKSGREVWKPRPAI